ncbi:MAG: hypothetical protein ACWA5U_02275 [bacterium]
MSDNPKESREQQNHLGTLLGGLGGFAAVLTVIIYSFVHPLLTALAGGENTGGYWWLLIFEGMFVVISCFWLIALASPNRKEHLASLQEEYLRQHYQQRLGKILDRLSHWFSKNINKNQHPVAYYWSASLWRFTLVIAVLYPFFTLLIQWLMGNQTAQLSDVLIFPAIVVWWQRLLIGFLLLLSGFALYRLFQNIVNDDSEQRFFWALIAFLPFIIAFSLALNNNIHYLLWVPLGVILFFVVWFYLVYKLSCWVSKSKKGFYSTIKFINLASAFALSVVGVAGFVMADTRAITITFTLAITILVLETLQRLQLIKYYLIRALLLNSLLLLLLGLVIIFNAQLGSTIRASLIFIGFLPIINAFFDYLSIGLTRYLLQKSLQSRFPALLGFVDAIGAAVFFLLLKASLLTLFILLQDANGEPLLPLLGEAGLLKQIEQQPHDFYWLYFVLFSTLIPTILHLNLACFSFAVTSFAGLRRWLKGLAERLHQPNEDWIKTVFAFLQLVLFSTVMIVVPLWAFSHLWQLLVFLIWGEPDVLKQLLSWAESYAEWVAAFRLQLAIWLENFGAWLIAIYDQARLGLINHNN